MYCSTYVIIRAADSNLAQVNGEDGVGARTLHVHLGAGGGARQSAQFQTLQHLLGRHRCGRCVRERAANVQNSLDVGILTPQMLLAICTRGYPVAGFVDTFSSSCCV